MIKSLITNDLIFDFVTEYATSTTIPDTVIDLEFNAFDAFISFLADKDLRYDTKAEKLMDQLKKKPTKKATRSLINSCNWNVASKKSKWRSSGPTQRSLPT